MSTIAAISTPSGEGGIGVIRISGEDAVSVAQKVFRSKNGTKLSSLGGYTALYGAVFDDNGEIDDCVALVFISPHSYTGEDVVELSVHGGSYVLNRTLGALINNGAIPAGRGEFTRRAFLNGKMSLTAAESVMDTIHAQGEQAMRAALSMRKGALYKKINAICENLITAQSHISAYIDFPDEDVEEVDMSQLLSLIETSLDEINELTLNFEKGKIIREGITAAIVGKPNVGKSTLMNRLCKTDKSIVTSVAGTTRDVVEETVTVGKTPIRLLDTAGIHDTADIVEKIGVEKAKESINSADVILAVFDVSVPLDEDDKSLILSLKGKNVLALVNKNDLEKKCDCDFIKNNVHSTLFVSLKQDSDITEIENEIEKIIGINGFDTSAAVISNLRQLSCAQSAKNHLESALNSLKLGVTLDAVGVCVQSAIESLYELSGESASETVIDRVFENFCVGK